MHRYLRSQETNTQKSSRTCSFIIPSSTGVPPVPRIVTRLLSSMPRADAIVLEAQPIGTSSQRLRPLPLTPFPVYTGTPTLTHLFGSPEPPVIQHPIARTREPSREVDPDEREVPMLWLDGNAYHRWGRGLMLGYRSYTGLEVEVSTPIIPARLLSQFGFLASSTLCRTQQELWIVTCFYCRHSPPGTVDQACFSIASALP